MPMLKFILVLLLSSLPLAHASSGLNSSYGQLKGAYFQALLAGSEHAAKLKKQMLDLVPVRTEEMLAHAPDANSKPDAVTPPSSGAQPRELDMIRAAQDLKKSEQEKLVKLYLDAKEQVTQVQRKRNEKIAAYFRANEKAQPQLKTEITALNEKEMNQMLTAVEASAKLIRQTGFDKDSAYRAYLREHRRTLPKFAP